MNNPGLKWTELTLIGLVANIKGLGANRRAMKKSPLHILKAYHAESQRTTLTSASQLAHQLAGVFPH